MKSLLFFIAVLVSIHFSRASSKLSLSQTALIESYFPCDSLLLRRSAWQSTYFESSVLPDSEQGITEEEFTRFAQTYGAECNAKLPQTNHILLCSNESLTLVPPKRARHAIVFMHGLQRREDVANFLPFFSRLLASEPALASTLHVECPLAPLRRITAADVVTPPVRVGRAWFDILSVPTDPASVNNICATSDRLGLYRTAELIDVIVRSQNCKLSIPSNQVVLMGHSLGALATLEGVLATNLPLAGSIVMAGLLPRGLDYFIPGVQAYNPEKRKYTVTMIHSTDDDVIPFSLANASAQIVKNVMESTGGGFQFKAIEGVDHFQTFLQSPTLYEIVSDALRKAFHCGT